MNPILFSAAKGAERVMLAQQVRANNLSQAETIGFKALMEHSTPMRLEGAGFLTSITSRTNSTINNFRQGEEIKTQRDLDIAIDGKGFIAVQGLEDEPDELYTRAGGMHLDADGNLFIGKRRVLGDQAPLVIPEYQALNISESGMISIIPVGGGANLEVGNIKLVRPEYQEMTLDKSGHFVAKTGENLAPDEVSVRSGYLEASNVSSLEELISIMSLTRQYEMQVDVMAKADEIAQIGNQLLKA